MDTYPQTLSTVVAVERFSPDKQPEKYSVGQLKKPREQSVIQTGHGWRESRLYSDQKRKTTCILTVTKIDSSSDPKTFQASVRSWGSTVSATYRVFEDKGGASCKLTMSLGVIPNNLWEKISVGYLFRSRFEQVCLSVIELDLFDYRKAAEKEASLRTSGRH